MKITKIPVSKCGKKKANIDRVKDMSLSELAEFLDKVQKAECDDMGIEHQSYKDGWEIWLGEYS